jgi:outer membrane protein TolC
MKIFNKYIISAAVIFAALTSLSAQDSTLTIEQCRTRAIAYNKQLKVAAYQKGEASAYQKAARTAYLPAISAEASIVHLPNEVEASTSGGFLPTAASEEDALAGNWSGISNVYSPGLSLQLDNLSYITGGVSLTQPIFTGGKIYYSNKQADAGMEMAEYGYQLKYGQVIELTDKAFWQVAQIEANIKLAESYIEMLTELEEQMNKMYELGLTPASEKLKVSVQKNQSELVLMQARNGLKIAKMYLNQVLGKNLNAAVNIKYDELNTSLFDMANGLELALNNRNELKLINKQVELSEYDKKIARADYLPSAGVSVQYSSIYISDLYDNMDFQPMIGAQINIPLFAWGQGHQKQKAAEFVIQQRQEELNRTTDLISLEVMQVKVQIEEAYEAILIAEKNIAEAEESLEETKASFEVGLNTTTDLLNAQASWQSAKAELINAATRFKVLETTWARATGNLKPVD